MSGTRRYLCLNAFLRNSGYHESAWKVAPGDPLEVLDLDHYVGLARVAERGILDCVFLADSPGIAEFRSEHLPGAGFDPVQLLSAIAALTEQIGLVPTISTTYSQPWDVARRVASLDFLSRGRAGWNVVTTAERAAAANFGDSAHPPRADRYARAEEFLEVVLKLWDSWEDGAVVASRTTGTWADPVRLHPPRHHGAHFDVASYLPFPRSPQGHPLLTQAGTSSEGVALAARYADAVFTPQGDIASATTLRAQVRTTAAAHGREPDDIRVLPGLSFLLASSEREAAARRQALEHASSSDFRWRNAANLSGIDHSALDPDAPFPAELLAEGPRTGFGAAIYPLLADGTSLREAAQRLSSLPGGLDFTGTPEAMADLITRWWEAGAADGFTVMPMVLPTDLELFVDHVVPLLQHAGIARTEYAGTTLREHLGLDRPGTA